MSDKTVYDILDEIDILIKELNEKITEFKFSSEKPDWFINFAGQIEISHSCDLNKSDINDMNQTLMFIDSLTDRQKNILEWVVDTQPN